MKCRHTPPLAHHLLDDVVVVACLLLKKILVDEDLSEPMREPSGLGLDEHRGARRRVVKHDVALVPGSRALVVASRAGRVELELEVYVPLVHARHGRLERCDEPLRCRRRRRHRAYMCTNRPRARRRRGRARRSRTQTERPVGAMTSTTTATRLRLRDGFGGTFQCSW